MKKTDAYQVKFVKNVASGGASGALSLCLVYFFDYARTRLVNDIKAAGKGGTPRQFNGLIDVNRKPLKSDGFVILRLCHLVYWYHCTSRMFLVFMIHLNQLY